MDKARQLETHEGYPESDGNSAEDVCDATDKEDESEAALEDTLDAPLSSDDD